jgi:hypothetical protein
MLRLARRSPEAHAVEKNGLPLGLLESVGYKEVELSLGGDFFGLDRLKATRARGSRSNWKQSFWSIGELTASRRPGPSTQLT